MARMMRHLSQTSDVPVPGFTEISVPDEDSHESSPDAASAAEVSAEVQQATDTYAPFMEMTSKHAGAIQNFHKRLAASGFDENTRLLFQTAVAPFSVDERPRYPIIQVPGIAIHRTIGASMAVPASLLPPNHTGPVNLACFETCMVVSARDGQEFNSDALVNPTYSGAYTWASETIAGNHSPAYQPGWGNQQANSALLQNAFVVFVWYIDGEEASLNPSSNGWATLNADRFTVMSIPQLMSGDPSAITGASLKVINSSPLRDLSGVTIAYEQPCPRQTKIITCGSEFTNRNQTGQADFGPMYAGRYETIPPPPTGPGEVQMFRSCSLPAKEGVLMTFNIDYPSLPNSICHSEASGAMYYSQYASRVAGGTDDYEVLMLPPPRPLASEAAAPVGDGIQPEYQTAYALCKRIGRKRKGFFMLGLQPETTLQATLCIEGMRVPTAAADPWISATTMQLPENIRLLEALMAAQDGLPVAEPAINNFLGGLLKSAASFITDSAGTVRSALGLASQMPGRVGMLAQAAETGLDLAGVPKENKGKRRKETRRDVQDDRESRMQRERPVARGRERRVRGPTLSGVHPVSVRRGRDGSEVVRIPADRL